MRLLRNVVLAAGCESAVLLFGASEGGSPADRAGAFTPAITNAGGRWSLRRLIPGRLGALAVLIAGER